MARELTTEQVASEIGFWRAQLVDFTDPIEGHPFDLHGFVLATLDVMDALHKRIEHLESIKQEEFV